MTARPRRLTLCREQPALSVQAGGVAGEGAVGAHDAVTRDDDGDRVGAGGGADGADGGRAPDAPRDLAVRARLAVRDVAQRAPDGELEGRAARGDRQVVDRARLSGEVREDRVAQRAGAATGDELPPVRDGPAGELALHACVPVGPAGGE